MHKIKEKPYETAILDYLSLQPGFVTKIEKGGRPIKKDGELRMIKFKNKRYTVGDSDIFYLRNGKLFCFEVKSPSEMKKIANWVKIKTFEKHLSYKSNERLLNQFNYLTAIITNGGYGGFVTSIEHVQFILDNLPMYIFYGFVHR